MFSLQILQGYKGEIMLKTDPEDTRIRACAVSPGGGKIAYGMEDGTVKVGAVFLLFLSIFFSSFFFITAISAIR